MTLSIGKPAPNFTLPDQNSKEHSLRDYRGLWVLIYFYPKDHTPGCTTEACTLRDSYPAFQTLEAKVFGVSADSVASHEKFVQQFTLPFTLLSDTTKETIKAYGAWGRKKIMGREYDGIFRNSVLVDPKGNVAKIYENVKPADHAEEVLKDISRLRSA
ncbi:MAG: thioredoxin-dependent thiol peroxidase [Parcubacteria group bacterium CG08_land_8_20_14_0_20_48_21]|nr:MAG: peroxiredoxin [Parcubacteria group bacterium CG2_30_48_51]PIS32887.1 MAG: thioredoxin-dependent thiol peroxidase [Parcubacteria group bacterium CG08_land_8_20_14_0_20_48_21]PIW78775.1 MAG: thioredoxin-dependent thiol peroxidase [Parcubacteria group bacterium CG_4_8_14_3_um_filter_48_16]PIY78256.1 MAG: thioredoxin-dependent thiol peroxidase [Parcubacteria group bacterium CG_4_10_14_0_8_um_filter_48_154]PIZ77607.1 MAG: thioredoxin-dependent thiol peroxidase [bacterium CG_4_10_14_0_2_um_fi